MNALRIGLMALAISVVSGLNNQTEAGKWVVRVELENIFTGHTYYPTLYSSPSKNDAASAYAWYELLMKVYPTKFRNDVLDDLGVPWFYVPVRLHFVYLKGIFPTGRLGS